MSEVYYGTVEKVIPPNSPKSITKTEYEYDVLISYYRGSSVLLEQVRKADTYGAGDDFEDTVLLRGQRVLVVCPKGQTYHSYIIAGIRSAFRPTSVDLDHHTLKRFNEIEVLIDNKGTWKLTSDEGPNISVGRELINLDSSEGDSILIDRVNKTVQITANEWQVSVKGNATISVQGDANISANNIKATATENINAQCKSLNVQADSAANIKTRTAKIEASKVSLAGEQGQVITTATQPTCFVTGIPFKGSTKVKAGS